MVPRCSRLVPLVLTVLPFFSGCSAEPTLREEGVSPLLMAWSAENCAPGAADSGQDPVTVVAEAFERACEAGEWRLARRLWSALGPLGPRLGGARGERLHALRDFVAGDWEPLPAAPRR